MQFWLVARHPGMVPREQVDPDAKRKAARSEYVDDAESGKANFEANCLQAASDPTSRNLGFFFTALQTPTVSII